MSLQRYVTVEVVVPEFGGLEAIGLDGGAPTFVHVDAGHTTVLQITEEDADVLRQLRAGVSYQEIERSVEIIDTSGAHGLKFVYAKNSTLLEPPVEAASE